LRSDDANGRTTEGVQEAMMRTRQVGDMLLRSCHTVEEFRLALRLQKQVWNFADVDLVPTRLFVVAEKIGGHLLGAFAGERMVGFAFGIPGYRNGRAYLHSHMLAVDPEFRDRGLGRQLKLLQRDIALDDGLDLIEWTFDPLEIKNSFLNIERLGAIVRRYSVNHYGASSSPLQGGLPSDRFVAEWWLRSERVEQTLLEGHHAPVRAEVTLDVPAEVYEWKANDAERAKALAVQLRNREALLKAFSAGLAVIAYERDERGNGKIVLGKWDGRTGSA